MRHVDWRHATIPLTRGHRIATVAVGIVFLSVSLGMFTLVDASWRWIVGGVLALAGLHYLRAAAIGHVAAYEDPPAPPWPQRVARSLLPGRPFRNQEDTETKRD